MKYDGYNGSIEIGDAILTISRDGTVARAAFGKNAAPRTIPLSAIAGVRLAGATRLKNGYIQILLAGKDAPELGVTTAASNADAVLFTHKGNDTFAALHDWLQGVAERNLSEGLLTAAPPEPAAGPVGRLDRLAQVAAEKDAQQKARVAGNLARQAGLALDEAIFTCQSHDDGRNAVVALFPDRIERAKPKKLTSLSGANQDVEMTPVRSVSSVQASKDGFKTKITVYASGNTIEFRFSHEDARRFKDELQKLMLHSATPAQAASAPGPVDVADQLAKFASLKQQGILTEEEFAEQKAKLLGR